MEVVFTLQWIAESHLFLLTISPSQNHWMPTCSTFILVRITYGISVLQSQGFAWPAYWILASHSDGVFIDSDDSESIIHIGGAFIARFQLSLKKWEYVLRNASAHFLACLLPAVWLLWNIFKCFAFLICVLCKMFVKYWFPSTMGLECSWWSFCFTALIHAALAAAKVVLCVPASTTDLGSVLGTGFV